jgi:hypothetical protein
MSRIQEYAAKGKIDASKIRAYDHATKTKVLSHLRQELGGSGAPIILLSIEGAPD